MKLRIECHKNEKEEKQRNFIFSFRKQRFIEMPQHLFTVQLISSALIKIHMEVIRSNSHSVKALFMSTCPGISKHIFRSSSKYCTLHFIIGYLKATQVNCSRFFFAFLWFPFAVLWGKCCNPMTLRRNHIVCNKT